MSFGSFQFSHISPVSFLSVSSFASDSLNCLTHCLYLSDRLFLSPQRTRPKTTNSGTMTATMASPAMNPEASGTIYNSCDRRSARHQRRSTKLPKNITKITAAGTSIPMPTPVGEGTQLAWRVSRSANMMPRTAAITTASTAPGGRALNPLERIYANPAHLREIGDEGPAFSPTIPYVSRNSG